MEQNYGPKGIALVSAAIISGLIGAVVGLFGLVLLLLSDDKGPLLRSGYYVIAAGILLEVPSLIRSIQAVRAGQQFRGHRPFVRRS
jgi:hypothetical protein